jgi:Protein of unknown function (DUF1579)
MSANPTENQPRLAAPDDHQRLPEHELMSSLVGKWTTLGKTIPTGDSPALDIAASDIYEWVPGGFFLLHTAYGRLGEADVGGIEIIGYDPETKKHRTHFFDSQGNITSQDLTFSNGTWTWSGDHARATGVLNDDGKAMPTLHEWSEDSVNWRPSMDVTLRKTE